MNKGKPKKANPRQASRDTKPKARSRGAAGEKAAPVSRVKPASSSSRASANTQRPAPVKRKPTPDEIAHQNALSRFESGLQLFGQNQFSKARSIFERLAENSARELAERARVYVRICDQRLSHAAVPLKTVDDYYNYAVGLTNQGKFEEAEQYLRKALKLAPKADYLYYALATTFALREDLEGSLENLRKAIELDERNRFQAQNDSDFAGLLEDPRFTELLYPEKL
jgi:tetratricopeptide (TPR) repeat protein